MGEEMGRWDGLLPPAAFATLCRCVKCFSWPESVALLCRPQSADVLWERELDIVQTRQSANGTRKDLSPMVACHHLLAFP